MSSGTSSRSVSGAIARTLIRLIALVGGLVIAVLLYERHREKQASIYDGGRETWEEQNLWQT